MPEEHNPLLCLDKQALSWAALWVRPRQLGCMVMRPNIKGLSDEAMRALVMSRGMAWTGISALKLPGCPEWVTAPFHLLSGASRSLVTRIVHTTHYGLSLWEELQEERGEGRGRRRGREETLVKTQKASEVQKQDDFR